MVTHFSIRHTINCVVLRYGINLVYLESFKVHGYRIDVKV